MHNFGFPLLSAALVACSLSACSFGPKQIGEHEGRPLFKVECHMTEGFMGMGASAEQRCNKLLRKTCKGGQPNILTSRMTRTRQYHNGGGHTASYSYYVPTRVMMVTC